jgi:hypothetical protein
MSSVTRPAAGERGAALVEFAVILPVLVAITFGAVEFGFALKATQTVSSATRSGVRTASSQPRETGYAQDAAAAVATALNVLPADAPQELWVYKADTNGWPVGRTGFGSGCDSDKCYRYTWVAGSRTWAQVSGTGWAPATQTACGGAVSDEVGVYLRVTHRYLTGLFGTDRTLTDHAVMRLEPVPGQCRP